MRVEKERDDALRRILAKRGSAVRIATELCITPQAVNDWKRVPAERVIEVEKITGVPREELRPDIYPSDDSQQTSHAEAAA